MATPITIRLRLGARPGGRRGPPGGRVHADGERPIRVRLLDRRAPRGRDEGVDQPHAVSENICYRDAYARSVEATVGAIVETERGPAVVLERTVFYPGGGGQPADTGWLESL